MKKVTAVELIEEKIKFQIKLAKMDRNNNVQWSMDVIISSLENMYYNECEQAKEMEKQQIIDAHGNKQRTKSNPDSIVTYGYVYTGEMYYQDKFEKL